jgi:ParB/RepB/Spo0J family partition protein
VPEAPAAPAGQVPLFPTERIDPLFAQLAPSQLLTTAVGVSPDFIENVRGLGIIQPIAVVETGARNRSGPTYRVAAGRRRVAAALALRMDRVPSMVYPAGTSVETAAAMALSENVQRRPNPLNDLESIETMMRAGHDERTVARELRLPVSTVRQRLRLSHLLPPLRVYMAEGRIAPTVAYNAARLDSGDQLRLLEMLRDRINMGQQDARITEADVHQLTTVQRAEQVEALPERAFATPGGPALVAERVPEPMAVVERVVVSVDMTIPEGWQRFVALLRAAEQAIPSAPDPEVEARMHELADMIEWAENRGRA